jgi:ankyrin repeat protein
MEMTSRVRAKRMVKETRRGDLERVDEMLRRGADINKLAPDGMTPLMRASYQGHGELISHLLRHGADPNKTAKDGASPLFWACLRGNELVADLLIAASADINAVRASDPPSNENGPSVLAAAISGSAPATLVQKLVRAGASLDYRYLGRDMRAHAEWCGRSQLLSVLKPTRGKGSRTRR